MLGKHAHVAPHRARILRLIDEVLNQGWEPTQEDLARALGVGVRTVRYDTSSLEAESNRLSTLGKLRRVGRGQTHNMLIVKLYLKRRTGSRQSRVAKIETRDPAASVDL